LPDFTDSIVYRAIPFIASLRLLKSIKFGVAGLTAWSLVGFLLSVTRRHVRKLALVSVLLLVSLCLGLGINNIVLSGTRTFLRRQLTVNSAYFLKTDCWREAALLLIHGLSLFNGSLPGYGAPMQANSPKRLIREEGLQILYLYFLPPSLGTLIYTGNFLFLFRIPLSPSAWPWCSSTSSSLAW